MNYRAARKHYIKGKLIKRCCASWNGCHLRNGMKFYSIEKQMPVQPHDLNASDWHIISREDLANERDLLIKQE